MSNTECAPIADTRALGAAIQQRRKALELRQDAVAMAAGAGVLKIVPIDD